MSEPEAEPVDVPAEEAAPPRRKKRWRVLGVLALLLGLGLLGVWLARDKIAHSIIAGQLEDLQIPGTYEVESVGTRRQVLKNVVIGDPARPDLTVARAVIEFEPRFGIPALASVELDGARLYGTYKAGKFSFGKLDKVIFGEGTGEKGLPDLDLILRDGRARIDSDYGVIGAKLDGSGNLRSGFAGTLAAVAPDLALAGCKGKQATLFGKLSTGSAKSSFTGPLRLQSLRCAKQGMALGNTNLQLEAEFPEDFAGAKGRYGLDTGALAFQGNTARTLAATGQFAFTKGDLVADYKVNGTRVDLGGAGAERLAIEGTLRSRDQLASFDGEGTVRANQVRTGNSLGPALTGLEKSGEGTLLAPLAMQLRTALAREERGSRFKADYTVRQTGGITQILLPSAELTGGSGTRLVGLSRSSLALGMRGGPRFSGRFVTGGAGLPRMEGTAQRKGAGGMEARFKLAEYRAGTSAVALPDLRVVQLPGGAIGFAGRALVSGPLPGGEARGLAMPIEGNWSARGGLSVWRRCTPVSFERFVIGNLALANRSVTLCPGNAGAILRSDGGGTRFAAGAGKLDLAGTLGGTPILLRGEGLGFAWPGKLAVRNIDVVMGDAAKPSTLKVARFDGMLGKVITGTFSGAELKLFPVPLDMFDGTGNLRFANNELEITGASLRVVDREKEARFYPLVGRDAAMQLRGGVVTAQAMLREPKSDREIASADIRHDLARGVGFADLKVPGVLFDGKLQPDMLTYAAQGVIALADGTMVGDGRIDWTPDTLTSTGKFTTDKLDFAAAFGPVKGARGTINFTDLLGLVTAPDQRFTLGSINPGIEVYDGTLSFEIKPDRLLVVNGAEWPFIDGTLKLLPTRMVLGNAETRRFTLKVDGANAAKFVNQLELGNISAAGTFDGTLPLVFDENGGRIENGLLVSRPPGGNLSYVGELTYKDLSAMGNFAFQTLRSLDFKRMEIGLNGQIDGDIVTTMRIEGVRQGKGAKSNLITRQFAGLPIQFNINIRAPFYQLVTSFKSMYDPAYIRDPRSLGLIDDKGNRRDPNAPPAPQSPATTPPAAPPPPKNDDIQPPESRTGP
jgi:Dicarboxylate transport